MLVGKRIKQRRKELKMTADELGARLGKDRSTIYRYENGNIEKFPTDILKPIAEALQTTPEALMGWDEEESPQPEGIVLSEGEQALIELFRRIPEDKQELVLQMIRVALGNQ